MWARSCSTRACSKAEPWRSPIPPTSRLASPAARFDWSRTPLSACASAAPSWSFHLILVAAIGPFIAPYGYAQMGAGIPLSGMSWAHPFGVDQLGRDIFSRVINGGHIVILLSLSGTALGLVLRRDRRPALRLYRRLGRQSPAALPGGADQHPVPGSGADGHRRGRARGRRQSAPGRLRRRAGLCARASPAWRARRPSTSRRAISSPSRGCAAKAPGRSCAASCCPMPPACCWSSSRCAPAMRRC